MAGFEVIDSKELEEVIEVFRNGGTLCRQGFDNMRGDCFKVRDFEKEFADFMGVEHALAVTSGTAALRVALAALNIGPGDEVVTQSFTFVATVEAIVEAGAVPVCTEIDNTFNMDPLDLKLRITPRTKAVILVHMLGYPANIPEIKELCDEHNLFLIEDTAWGCGGNLLGKPLGTWGDIGTFSFDYAKTITTGEGGMLVFQSSEVFERASAWHDHGHENNPAKPRWEDTRNSSGFNFRMMELQGAVGLAQLRKLPDVIQAQRANHAKLWAAIEDLPGIEPRSSVAGSYETADALIFLLPNKSVALRFREELLEVGMGTKILPEAYTWHFSGTWSHISSLLESHNGDLETAFPRSLGLLSRAVSLPVGVKMDERADYNIRKALQKALAL